MSYHIILFYFTFDLKISIPSVNGSWSVWSTWGSWGVCQESSCIGQQKRLRTRACTDPKPRNGGRRCRGSSFQWMSRSCKPFYSKGKSYLQKNNH